MLSIGFFGFPSRRSPGKVRAEKGECYMDLEESLSRLLDEHQREDGLHMIGGRQKLIYRLVEFFESGYKVEEKEHHDAA
jgi:hypothetical protein